MLLTCAHLRRLDGTEINEASFEASTADADEDGLDDELEGQIGLDPTKQDSDEDGWSDLAELINGTDPQDENDYPRGISEDAPSPPAGKSGERLKVIELLLARRQQSGNPAVQEGATFSLRYYYPPGHGLNLAGEITRNDLSAGSYLIMWKHKTQRAGPASVQRYVVTIRRDDGTILRSWQTPKPVGSDWSHVGLPFNVRTEDAGRRLTLEVRPENNFLGYDLGRLTVVKAGVEADADRDGIIVIDEQPSPTRPLRHWINDDDDEGDCQERGDIPGQPEARADHARPGIDGTRDLVDFMPVNLNIAELISNLSPADGFRYYLSHPEDAIQVVTTSLTPASVGAIHRNPQLKVFGASGDADWRAAETMKPDTAGRIELPRHFIESSAAAGHGVVLIEGTKSSRAPLRLIVAKDDDVVTEITLPLSLSAVETMYRHVNLCAAAREYDGRSALPQGNGRATHDGEPAGLPDAETSERWVLFIHGYNVPADGARGWHAETFKRLRATGTNCRFVGLTWHGDTGLDYHKAVFHAFQTGERLPAALGFLDQSRTTLIAHSLGNIVACEAVQVGFSPASYYLLNAALPIEAIAGEASRGEQAWHMTEALWRPYARRLFSAEWAKLHRPGSPRAGYAWANCFSRVRLLGIAVNCYSSGEDVTNCPTGLTTASVLDALWSERAVDYGVWKTQELLKGVGWSRSLGALAMSRAQGGWGFHPAWRGRFIAVGPSQRGGGHYERLDPRSAERITDVQLLKTPFFRPFEERHLHGQASELTSPLAETSKFKYDLLARAIPALSYAAGGAPLPDINGNGRSGNLDLEAQGRRPDGVWPEEGHDGPSLRGRWLHSDFKNMALPFVYPLYNTIVARDSLR